MGEYGELEHIKHHEKFVKSLDLNGCNFGKLTKQKLEDFKRSIHSKIEDFETTSSISLETVRKSKDEIGGLKVMVHDAINSTHAANKKIDDMEVRTNDLEGLTKRLPWKLLWVVIGANGLFYGIDKIAHLIGGR